MNRRVAGVMIAVKEAVGATRRRRIPFIGDDDDFRVDLKLDAYDCQSVGLMIEEVYDVVIPDDLWESSRYRTPAALAEWIVRKSEEQAWEERQKCSRRG